MKTDEILELVEKFKNREVKAKEIFNIKEVPKPLAYSFVQEYHYLEDAKFFSQYQVGLFIDSVMVGVATYSLPQGTQATKGWIGEEPSYPYIMELSRLTVIPQLNGTNATSFLLSNSLKVLKKHGIKIVITLADASRHVGSIYQVCNFKYYGLTAKNSDFWTPDGRVNPRGKISELKGVWVDRTRKHRYAYILDKKTKVLYEEQPRPKTTETQERVCCKGTGFVLDKRSGEQYNCPVCNPETNALGEW